MKRKSLPLLLALALGLVACKTDADLPIVPDPIENEGELITTLKLNLVDSAGIAPAVSVAFRDVDGTGGNAPTIDSLKLQANTTYLASLVLLDETQSPADSISNEVKEEANDHQFFFSVAGLNIAFTYLDKDANNLPLGLESKWRTGAAAIGGVSRIILMHQPGTKDNSQNTGDTDIDVSFPTQIF